MAGVIYRDRTAPDPAGTPVPSDVRRNGVIFRDRAATAEAAPAPTPEAPGIVSSFLNRGREVIGGIGNLALEAGKSAMSLEGQVTFLPKLVKGMYEGAVDTGAQAIARQLPSGVDKYLTYSQAARAGAAAVPVVGPYVMNKVSDIEEGKTRKVIGETGFDIMAAAMSGGRTPALKAASRVKTGAREVVDMAKASVTKEAIDKSLATGITTGAITINPQVGIAAASADLARQVIPTFIERWRNKGATVAELKAAAKKLADDLKMAERDTIASAKAEVKAIERSEKAQATAAKTAQADSFKSAGIEVKILEAAQKAQKEAETAVASATRAAEKAVGMERAKAQAALQTARAKMEAAAQRTMNAEMRAEAAQIKREFRQRTQMDREAAKAQKSSPAPAQEATPGPKLDSQGRPDLADPATFQQVLQPVQDRAKGTLAASARAPEDIAAAVQNLVRKLHKKGAPTSTIVEAVAGIPEVGFKQAPEAVSYVMDTLKLSDNPPPKVRQDLVKALRASVKKTKPKA